MTSVQDINAQIAEIERRKAMAALSERERIEAEQSNQRAVREAEQQLAALHEQKRNAELQRDIERNDQLIAAYNQQVAEFTTELNAPVKDFAKLSALYAAVKQSWERQYYHTESAVEHFATAGNTDRSRQAYMLTYPKFKSARYPVTCLIEWINTAKNPDQRRLHQAMVYYLDGQQPGPYDPVPEYNAQAVTDGDLQTRRSEQFRMYR